MNRIVVITGATGHIGKALAERLLQGNAKIRVVGRDAGRLTPFVAKGAEARVGHVEDTPFLIEAFRGARAVFAMIPPNYDAPDMRATQRRLGTSLAEALKTAEVPYAVALSSVGANLPAGTGPIAGLHDFEEVLKTVPGLSTVALRPTFFMENFLFSIPLIKGAGINGSPLRADVSLPLVATRDIAAVAAELLASPAFEGFSVREILGPCDHTFPQATSILGSAIGRPDLAYMVFSNEDFRKGLLGAGFSPSVAEAFLEMYDAFNAGRVQSTVNRTSLNTTPTTLEEFAREVFAPAFDAS